MAYALGFPKDVTEHIYSMRDAKNWNGDKYRRGANRDVANWWDSRELLSTLQVDRLTGVITSGVIYPALTSHLVEKYIIQPDGIVRKIHCEIIDPFDKWVDCTKKRRRQLQEMWWQCEPCEPRSNMRW